MVDVISNDNYTDESIKSSLSDINQKQGGEFRLK